MSASERSRDARSPERTDQPSPGADAYRRRSAGARRAAPPTPTARAREARAGVGDELRCTRPPKKGVRRRQEQARHGRNLAGDDMRGPNVKRLDPCCPFFRSRQFGSGSSLKIRSSDLMPKLLPRGIWVLVASLAARRSRTIALTRGETINAAWLLTAAVCSYAIAYRFYSKLIAAKVFALDASRTTPAVRLDDGRDYVPTNRWIVFGHHFAAIAGPGPARRANAGRAVRLSARRHLDHRRRRARRRGAGLRHPRVVGPPQRQIARPDGARGDRTRRRRPRRSSPCSAS